MSDDDERPPLNECHPTQMGTGKVLIRGELVQLIKAEGRSRGANTTTVAWQVLFQGGDATDEPKAEIVAQWGAGGSSFQARWDAHKGGQITLAASTLTLWCELLGGNFSGNASAAGGLVWGNARSDTEATLTREIAAGVIAPIPAFAQALATYPATTANWHRGQSAGPVAASGAVGPGSQIAIPNYANSVSFPVDTTAIWRIGV